MSTGNPQFGSQNSPEKISEIEKTFNEYVTDLRIKPEDFKKVILDVGAGEAHFAKWAKDHNISSQIHSLEPLQEMSLKENALVASAEEIPMPDKSFDLVVSNGAIPGIYIGEDNVEERISKSFSEMLRVLKDGGEIRLARVLIGHKYENQRIFASGLENLLKELREKHNIEIEKIHTPPDTYVFENDHPTKELLAESFLIILKKKTESQSEKEIEWEKKRAEIEETADALGQGIDKGIKETVIAFNVNGIPTSMSCEGHDDPDYGFPVPWITVKTLNEPEWRFEHEEEIFKRVAEKYGVTLDQVLRADNQEAWSEAEILSAEHEETLEYKKWKEENHKLLIKVEALLKEFYTGRDVSDEVRIITDEWAGSFDVHNGGKFYIPNFQKERLQNELTEEERKRIPEVLKACQKEMQDFTAFLKAKFFKE